MVLPAILGGLGTGVGSGLASGLFGLFGGGGNSQAQSFDPQAFLNSYMTQLKGLNESTLSFLKDKNDMYEEELNQYRGSNPQTESNFKNNYKTYLDTANKAIDSGAMSTEQAKNWFQDIAFSSGVNPGTKINDQGNTLLDVTTAFDTKKLEKMPEEWNRNLSVVYNDFLGRNPTSQEFAKYNLKDYQNIDNVIGSLGRNNKDFYARNLGVFDPSTKAAADFWTGGAVAIYDDPYKRFGLDSKTGKPLEATSKVS